MTELIEKNQETIGGAAFAAMVRGGASQLHAHRAKVNDLNVFPVPDGDTGDNMYMTMQGGAGAEGSDALGTAAAAISHGMLLGARGNSGVILSRLFAGIARGLADRRSADTAAWSYAVGRGVKEAYAAVSHPVEGTMLTVLRVASQAADDAQRNGSCPGIGDWLTVFCAAAERALEETPTQLDVLRQAGVVDSGGAGLCYIFEGMRRVTCGEATDESTVQATASGSAPDLSAFGPDDTLTWGYCTEFLLRLQTAKVDPDSFSVDTIKTFLNDNGNSVVAFRDGTIVKAHVHTAQPGVILNEMQKYGEFLTLKIENMTLQHNENDAAAVTDAPVVKHKAIATVAVAAGEGVKRMFSDLGADAVVDGGQSMNPSTEDFLRAFAGINADNILVFPNNGNVVMAAEQAASLYENAHVRVIKTKTIGAGYAALSMLDTSSGDPDTVAEGCLCAMEGVATGLVSRVSREAVQNGFSLHAGDYIGYDAETETVLSCAKTPGDALLALADALDAGSRDVIMVSAGMETDPGEAETLAETLQERGLRIVSGKTESHVMLVDLRAKHVTGKLAQDLLGRVCITANKNGIHNDPEKPTVTSGIRVGTPAVTSRGFLEEDMRKIAHWMKLAAVDFEGSREEITKEVIALCDAHPIYED